MLYRLLAVAALGVISSTPVFAAGDSEPQVIIKEYKFVPQHITVKQGQTLVWENREKRQYHSIWFEALDEEEPDYIFPEETYQRTFPEIGTFSYRCGPHPEMTGTVTVIE